METFRIRESKDGQESNGVCPCGDHATRTVRLDLFELDLCEVCLDLATNCEMDHL